MKPRKVYQELASLVVARQNCEKAGNAEWLAKHETRIESIMRDTAPSGSGIDNGTKIDMERSNDEKLVFTFGFHFMDENGYYDGWGDFTAVVRPSLAFGILIDVKGRNRNDVKSYLHDVFSQWLESEDASEYQEADKA